MDNTNDQLSDAKPGNGEETPPPESESPRSHSDGDGAGASGGGDGEITISGGSVSARQSDRAAAVSSDAPDGGGDEPAPDRVGAVAETPAPAGGDAGETSESDVPDGAPGDGDEDDPSATQTASLPQKAAYSADELRERAREHATGDDGEMPALPAVGVSVELDDRVLAGVAGWGAVETAVRRLPADARQIVLLECGALERIDSVGLGRLLLLVDAVRAEGGRVVLIDVAEDVAALLRTLQLEEDLPIVGSLGDLADRGLNPVAASALTSDDAASALDTGMLEAMEVRLRDDLKHSRKALEGVWQSLHAQGNASQEQMAGLREVRSYLADAGRSLGNVQHYINEIAQRMTAFEGHLNKLTHYFNDRFREDKVKEQAFDTLYEDLKKYRDNFLFQAQKPVFKSLVILHDDAQKMAESMPDDEGREKFNMLREMLLELLYRNDVEVMDERPERFDRDRQKAIRREFTDDPARDYMVKEVVREGFMWADRILRPQEVVVLRYDENASVGSPAPVSGRVAAISSDTAGISGDDDDDSPPDALPARPEADDKGDGDPEADWNATNAAGSDRVARTVTDDGEITFNRPEASNPADADSGQDAGKPASDDSSASADDAGGSPDEDDPPERETGIGD